MLNITEETYKDLSQRIDEGEFMRLKYKTTPSVPAHADEQLKAFAKECEGTISLYRAKTNALWGQLQSMRKIVEEKEATDRANLFVKNYDQKLEEQYTSYRASAEETIAQLKQDLAEIKELANNSINENKILKTENDALNDATVKLKNLTSQQELKIKELEKTLDYKFPYLLIKEEEDEDVETKNLLQEKDAEIERLRNQCSEKDKAIQDMSTASIEACLEYYTDTERTKDESSDKIINTVKSTLTRIVKQGFIPFIGEGPARLLVMLITDLEDNREKFKKQQQEITAQQALLEQKKRQEMEQERTLAIKESTEAIKQNGKGGEKINIEKFYNQDGATFNDFSNSSLGIAPMKHLQESNHQELNPPTDYGKNQ